VEASDRSLRRLRGYTSIVFHLLELGTELAHFQERHMRHCRDRLPTPSDHAVPSVGCRDVPDLLRRFPLRYAALYLQAGRALAQSLLQRYAEPWTIDVPVPSYRGFHVRPASLVARVVHHYGSAVSMTLEGETFDASSTLDLFRANEKINAHKRRRLAAEAARLCESLPPSHHRDLARMARKIILALVEHSKVILYEQPIPTLHPRRPDSATDFNPVIEEATRLHALGKIDIETNLAATFKGDKRVLQDIRRLAECGYGEDAYGNNVALPKELAYLQDHS